MEIGAGRGALTLPLTRVAQRVIAVEIDATLIASLRSQFDDHIELVCEDFLQMPLPGAPYKAFGNVPFTRTTDIVSKLVRAPNPPRDAWLVVQREAAHRFCGPPYVRESLWSLAIETGVARRNRRPVAARRFRSAAIGRIGVAVAAPPRPAVVVRFGSARLRTTDRTRVLREHEPEQNDRASGSARSSCGASQTICASTTTVRRRCSASNSGSGWCGSSIERAAESSVGSESLRRRGVDQMRRGAMSAPLWTMALIDMKRGHLVDGSTVWAIRVIGLLENRFC